MYKGFWLALVGSILTFSVIWYCGLYVMKSNTENDYTQTVEVLSLGQCIDNSCSFTYKDTYGEIKYGESYSPVSVGQKVHRECGTRISDQHVLCERKFSS